ALFGGVEREVWLRVASHEGRYYLDLGRAAVEFGPDGWRIVSCPPVYFRRPAGMLPLPVPSEGGSLGQLGALLNVGGAANLRAVIGWLLMTFRPTGPYPVLVVHGEQGSAKSTLSRALLSLIDPRVPALRSMPRSEQEMAIWAKNAWALGVDNVSAL